MAYRKEVFVNEPKLEKSVDHVPQKSSKMEIALMVAIAALVLSLMGNLILKQSYDQEDRQNRYCWEANHKLEGRLEEARRAHASLRADVEAMSDTFVPHGILTKEGRRTYVACLKDPSGSIIAPERLFSDGRFPIHNPGAVMNADGDWYLPGQTCRIGSGDAVMAVGRVLDLYKFQVVGMGLSRPKECPADAYFLVWETNALAENAVVDACLSRAKAFEIERAR